MAEEYVVVSDKMDDGEMSLNSQVRSAATPRKCKALDPGGNDRQQAQLPGNEAFAPPPAKCFFEFTRPGSKGGKELPEACNVELNYSYMVEDNRRDPSACAR